jgi:hypothetical protein
MIDEAKTLEDFHNITDVLAAGDLVYAYPYQLKLFIIKYASFVKQNFGAPKIEK